MVLTNGFNAPTILFPILVLFLYKIVNTMYIGQFDIYQNCMVKFCEQIMQVDCYTIRVEELQSITANFEFSSMLQGEC